ncbi:MAG: hypothetical protein RQ745_08345 [Longimicrobiales bacterium]|nr:hypothetical protein [Longimicrobiales bacterium]
MILRVYGQSVQSVEVHFNSRAFHEVGFRRDHRRSFPLDDFEREWERVAEHEIADRGEGRVQDETQQAMLNRMREHLESLLSELSDDEALRIENDETDWPKARDVQRTIIEDGENRLHFTAWVEPPLRVAVWRRRS